jgi:hypothetical protein
VLERAFRDAGEPFDLVTYDAEGPDVGRFIHRPHDGEPRRGYPGPLRHTGLWPDPIAYSCCIPDGSHRRALRSIRIIREKQMHQGAIALIDVGESSKLIPTARIQRSRPDRKPLKTVAPVACSPNHV